MDDVGRKKHRFRRPRQAMSSSETTTPPEPISRSILVLDIEQFGHPNRDDQVRVGLRRVLSAVLADSLVAATITPDTYTTTTTGDGLLVEIHPAVPPAKILRALLDHMTSRLDRHNLEATEPDRLRARAVVHAAHMLRDEQGMVGEQVNLAFRLLDSDALRACLRAATGPLVIAVSDEPIYRQIIRHRHLQLDPAAFEPIQVVAKETSVRAWVCAPGDPGVAGPAGRLEGRRPAAGRQPGRRPPGRTRLILALGVGATSIAIVVAIVAAATAERGTHPAANTTEILDTRVYGEDGTLLPGFEVVGRTQADGCTRSLRSGNAEALRCFGADHVVYDPCWVNFDDVAACLVDPWTSEVTEVHQAEAPGQGGAIDPNTFWALELDGGERCTFASGTAAVVTGERANYRCDHGVVVGDPDRSSQPWTARYNQNDSREVIPVQVRRAWR